MNALQIIGVIGSSLCTVGAFLLFPNIENPANPGARTCGVLLIGAMIFVLVFAVGRMKQAK